MVLHFCSTTTTNVTCSLLIAHASSNSIDDAVIGDVRGKGLMLGVELVTDHELKTPAKAEIIHIMEQMKGLGSFLIHKPFASTFLELSLKTLTNINLQ